MALEAHIACNCFLKGKTKPFPAPGFEQYFVYEEGWWHMNIPDSQYEELENEVERWRENACEHPDMIYYYGGVTAWSNVARLEKAMRRIGPNKFPVSLQGFESMYNFKQMSLEAVTQMLDELVIFEQQESLGSAYFLMHTDESIPVLDSIDRDLYMDRRSSLNYGFERDSLFVEDRVTNTRLFQANRFEFKLTTPSDNPQSCTIEFKALDTNQHYIGDPFYLIYLPIHPPYIDPAIWKNGSYYVEQHPIPTDAFIYVVDDFREILQASLEVDMPISWRG